jgi:hypothetical protein
VCFAPFKYSKDSIADLIVKYSADFIADLHVDLRKSTHSADLIADLRIEYSVDLFNCGF